MVLSCGLENLQIRLLNDGLEHTATIKPYPADLQRL